MRIPKVQNRSFTNLTIFAKQMQKMKTKFQILHMYDPDNIRPDTYTCHPGNTFATFIIWAINLARFVTTLTSAKLVDMYIQILRYNLMICIICSPMLLAWLVSYVVSHMYIELYMSIKTLNMNLMTVAWFIRQVIIVIVIWWRHQMETFPRYWPFVRRIHRSPVNSPHKGQWRGALMFSLICTWINGWVNNGDAGDLRRHHTHYDVIVMRTWTKAICKFNG